MVIKNTKSDLLNQKKAFAKKDTSYSSFWLYNRDRDVLSEHFKDKFVNYYDEKELLSEFNVNVAKNIISYWSEDKDVILDPFAGRTRAIVSYAMNRSYIGYEVSKDVVQYMYNRFDELGILRLPNFMVDIRNEDCINIEKDIGEVDMIFTCPPYWDLEKYESCPGQLSDIKNYKEFLDELYIRLNMAGKCLKKGKYMCLVIGDFRRDGKYYTLHSDLIRMFENNNDVKLHDIIVMQNIPFHTAAFYFGSMKKNKITTKAHEYLLVYKRI
jgi:DNA modification methylase